MADKPTYFVAVVHHDHGLDVLGIFSTEEMAYDELYEYVCRWWDDLAESSGTSDDSIPEKPDKTKKREMISLYFDNHPKVESGDVHERTVDDSNN